MAKLIYETDKGEQVTFQIKEDLVTELESLHDIDAWIEIMKVIRSEIIAKGLSV